MDYFTTWGRHKFVLNYNLENNYKKYTNERQCTNFQSQYVMNITMNYNKWHTELQQRNNDYNDNGGYSIPNAKQMLLNDDRTRKGWDQVTSEQRIEGLWTDRFFHRTSQPLRVSQLNNDFYRFFYS